MNALIFAFFLISSTYAKCKDCGEEQWENCKFSGYNRKDWNNCEDCTCKDCVGHGRRDAAGNQLCHYEDVDWTLRQRYGFRHVLNCHEALASLGPDPCDENDPDHWCAGGAVGDDVGEAVCADICRNVSLNEILPKHCIDECKCAHFWIYKEDIPFWTKCKKFIGQSKGTDACNEDDIDENDVTFIGPDGKEVGGSDAYQAKASTFLVSVALGITILIIEW